MTLLADRYDRWIAPAEDGQVLIWPPPQALLADAQFNQQLFREARTISLQGVPLPEVRESLRRWIGLEPGDDRLLFATGHQTELYHPGVWAKDALIDAAAAKTGGLAHHFAVDTDAPKHLQLRWPGGGVPLADALVESAPWSGLLPPPTPAHLNRVAERFAQASASWNFQPLVNEFLLSLCRLALEAEDLPTSLTNATHDLDWRLGLRHHALLVSPICMSEPYLLFVHHLLSRADAFSADYNAVLKEYRVRNKIRSPGRPMPDLQCTADGCEVPFWLDSLADGSRARAAVARVTGGFELRLTNGASFFFDVAAEGWSAVQRLGPWLRAQQVRLSPRALTLTAVIRLLAADQFVHGIGGGQYDQVLDGLIARHWGLEPPRFSVTTATLYFPQAAGQARVCLPCLEQEGHALRHSLLGAEKMRMVGLIEALPRRSPERSSLFYEMHDKLASAWSGPRGRAWDERIKESEALAQAEKALFDRELFYAIQPVSRLTALIDRYRTALG